VGLELVAPVALVPTHVPVTWPRPSSVLNAMVPLPFSDISGRPSESYPVRLAWSPSISLNSCCRRPAGRAGFRQRLTRLLRV
jgi:hypothetical protein